MLAANVTLLLGPQDGVFTSDMTFSVGNGDACCGEPLRADGPSRRTMGDDVGGAKFMLKAGKEFLSRKRNSHRDNHSA